jgi:hypothetical protein
VFFNASADVPPSGTNARSSIERRGIRLGYEIIAIFPKETHIVTDSLPTSFAEIVSNDFPILHAIAIMRGYESGGAGLSFSVKTPTGMPSHSAGRARSRNARASISVFSISDS